MHNRFAEFVLLRPRGLIVVGNLLSSLASALMVLGAILQTYMGAIAAVYRLGGQLRPEPTLADVIPSLPSWWIPETAAGFVFAILAAIAGALIAHVGRNVERLLLG